MKSQHWKSAFPGMERIAFGVSSDGWGFHPLRMALRLRGGRMAMGFVFVSLLFLVACGDAPTVQSPNQDIPVVNPDTTNKKSLEAFEAHVQARVAAKDTAITAHEKLLSVLTDSIAGYRLEFRESNRFGSLFFSFSEANKVFYNPEEDYVELTLGDYIDNPDFFRVSIQRYNLAQGVEISGVKDEKRTVQGLKPQHVTDFFCWSSFNARKQIAWVFMGVNERYFLTIEATGQHDFLDLERVKDWLDWGKLVE